MKIRLTLAALLGAALLAGPARADLTANLKKGAVQLKSAGALAFGPDNVLFVGDSAGAMIYAVGTGDSATGDKAAALNVEGINSKMADLLGTTADKISVGDMKVNPATGNLYMTVSRGAKDGVAILRVDKSGKITELALTEVPFASVKLPNASEKQRNQSITNMAYVDGRLYVAGLSNEEFASTLRSIAFPFKDEADKGTGIEIYHGAHGRFETNAPVKTFTTFDINGQAHLLAALTCTPLVKIPVESLKAGGKYRATTVAELGNRNVPLDMVVYQKDGKTFVLMANSARGVMKVDTTGIDKVDPIIAPVTGGGTAGLKYETVEGLKGVLQLDRLNDSMAVMLIQPEKGVMNLKSMELP
jgi:hypothetical protein